MTIYRHGRHGNKGLARRLTGWLVIGGFAIGILAGCAEGTASDAERGKQIDAERTSVISDLQATESALTLDPGTPAPSPTPTEAP